MKKKTIIAETVATAVLVASIITIGLGNQGFAPAATGVGALEDKDLYSVTFTDFWNLGAEKSLVADTGRGCKLALNTDLKSNALPTHNSYFEMVHEDSICTYYFYGKPDGLDAFTIDHPRAIEIQYETIMSKNSQANVDNYPYVEFGVNRNRDDLTYLPSNTRYDFPDNTDYFYLENRSDSDATTFRIYSITVWYPRSVCA